MGKVKLEMIHFMEVLPRHAVRTDIRTYIHRYDDDDTDEEPHVYGSGSQRPKNGLP